MQKGYNITNHSRKNITYDTQNMIYLLPCHQCNVQYVGETTFPFHTRINVHNWAESGCNNAIRHFKMFLSSNVSTHQPMHLSKFK